MSGQNELDVSGPDIPRRRALRVAAAAALATVVWSPSASAEPVGRIDNDEALEGALPALSNWGRWGEDDQLGTLNFISPQTRLAAAALIRTGRVVPISREFSPSTPELRDFTYTMRRYDDPLPEEAGSYDIVGMTCHGFAVTHVDALCHFFTPEGKHGMYNGFSIDDVTDVGATKLGIEHVAATGIIERARHTARRGRSQGRTASAGHRDHAGGSGRCRGTPRREGRRGRHRVRAGRHPCP